KLTDKFDFRIVCERCIATSRADQIGRVALHPSHANNIATAELFCYRFTDLSSYRLVSGKLLRYRVHRIVVAGIEWRKPWEGPPGVVEPHLVLVCEFRDTADRAATRSVEHDGINACSNLLLKLIELALRI